MKFYKIIIATTTVVTLFACGTKKNIERQAKILPANSSHATTNVKTNHDDISRQRSVNFLQKVYEQNLYQKNLVSNLTFTLTRNGNSISVPGILRMRKDEVIRLQLLIPLLRSEVGRIEFTKDYVLFMDRIHKQYVKANYNDINFLRNNGINFYSLQAFFWNELFMPTNKYINKYHIPNFDVKATTLQALQSTTPITLKDGKITYTWLISNISNHINKAQAIYHSSNNSTSTLSWEYSSFTPFGSKLFPALHYITLNTAIANKKNNINIKLSLEGFSDKNNWETITTPSSSYSRVKPEDILKTLINL